MALESALFLYIVIIFSAIIHEYFHGWMAYYLGDPTAKYAGRLTLNPMAHIDPFGTVILPIFLILIGGVFIGYAKPVPFNPLNLRNQKKGIAYVGLAGPASNLAIALILGLIVRFFGSYPFLATISPFLLFVVLVNIWLALFNLLPIPPLDGSKVLLGLAPRSFESYYHKMEQMGMFGLLIAFFLAMSILPYLVPLVFNLIVGHYI